MLIVGYGVTEKSQSYETCRWKECQRPPSKGAVLCEVHIAEVRAQSGKTLGRFVKSLPVAVGIGVAGNAVYNAIMIALHSGLFPELSDLNYLADGYRKQKGEAIRELERFLRHNRHPEALMNILKDVLIYDTKRS